MKFTYLFGALALSLTIGCNNPTENATQAEETTNVVEMEAPTTDVVVEEEIETEEAITTDSEVDSTAAEEAEAKVEE